MHKAVFMDFLIVISTMIDEMRARLIKTEDCNKKIKQWINEKNCKGSTPLHLAAFKGNIEVIHLLMANGADMECLNNREQNVMHMAVQGDSPNALIYFQRKFLMSFNSKDENGSTPLHLACYYGSEHSVLFLVSWNCNLDLQDMEGYTPLHLAVLAGN